MGEFTLLPEVAAVVAGIWSAELTWKNEPSEPLWVKTRNEFGFVPAARKLWAVQLSEAADVPFQYDPFHDSVLDPKLLPDVAVPGLRAVIDGSLPSGRYRAQEISAAEVRS